MTPQEEIFNAEFGDRLRWVREAMDLSRTELADRLGVTKEQIKRFETRSDDRPHQAFPLYLLPELIKVTLEPYEFWVGKQPSKHWRFKVVTSR